MKRSKLAEAQIAFADSDLAKDLTNRGVFLAMAHDGNAKTIAGRFGRAHSLIIDGPGLALLRQTFAL
jgi:hypothetical protein